MENQNEMREMNCPCPQDCGGTCTIVVHGGQRIWRCDRCWYRELFDAPAAALPQPNVSPVPPAPLDLKIIGLELHDARHRDSEMSDWARMWGQLLLDEVRRLMELSAHPPVVFYQPDNATAEKLRELLRSQWEGSGAGKIVLGPVSEK